MFAGKQFSGHASIATSRSIKLHIERPAETPRTVVTVLHNSQESFFVKDTDNVVYCSPTRKQCEMFLRYLLINTVNAFLHNVGFQVTGDTPGFQRCTQ